MKKNFFIDAGFVFLYIFSACLMNMIVSSLVLKIIDAFVLLDYFVLNIVKMIVSAVVVAGILGVIIYLLSYRKASFSIGYFSGIFFTGVALQLALSILLKFHTFISGGVIYLAGIFEHGSSIYYEGWEYVGIIDYILAFLIFTAIYYAVSLICGKIAVNNRLRDREELLGKIV